MQTDSDVKYFLADHLGSTNALTDSSGNVTSSASYDSFGNATGNLATRYKFTGREYDDFTGLPYYRARWYDGNLGRFISEDPIGFAGGDVGLYVRPKALKFVSEAISILRIQQNERNQTNCSEPIRSAISEEGKGAEYRAF